MHAMDIPDKFERVASGDPASVKYSDRSTFKSPYIFRKG